MDPDETAAQLGFVELMAALRQGFATGCQVPVRHHHTMRREGEPDATLLLMPAWTNSDEPEQFLGVKVVTVVPGNSARNLPGLVSTYMLYDARTGQQLALMDGNTITGRRTAATSALAASYLSRANSTRLLVIGAGRVGSLLPGAYRAVRPIEEVEVWDTNPEAAERMVEKLKGSGVYALVANDLEKAVRSADIISAATLATIPMICGEWLGRGTHVDLIGGFTPKMREADDDAIRGAAIYVDSPTALHEAGDLVQPIGAGVIGKDAICATLSDLCRGTGVGRVDSSQITLFKAVGSALADLVAATMAYKSFHRQA